MKNTQKIAVVIVFLSLFSSFSCENITNANTLRSNSINNAKNIKIALLLDTSNSMDGLIEQAKSQLWILVNELAKAKCDNTKPNISIALYEYGNDNLPSSEGYIRQVVGFSNDLDKISEKLFALTTRGGNEFCGQVINTSMNQLDWSEAKEDLQIIFIAGNEPFNQRKISYQGACQNAKEKNIIVNTIFCGNFKEGVSTYWKDGAIISGGNYMSIDQNRKTVYIETPYDLEITSLNNNLNETYIFYGKHGKKNKYNQTVQDHNASSYGNANYVNRAVSKSQHVYMNSGWDLVDASESKDFKIEKVDKNTLPKKIQNYSDEQLKKYILDNKKKRIDIKNEILELNKKREVYITKNKSNTQQDENLLDQAMIRAITKQANAKKFVFE